ncbi:hypothetical protein BDV26DRAFT_276509, partial [Aspergillus bertholletiae]
LPSLTLLHLTNPFFLLFCPVVVLCYISVSYILHECRNGAFGCHPSLIICGRHFLVLSYKIPRYMLLIDAFSLF